MEDQDVAAVDAIVDFAMLRLDGPQAVVAAIANPDPSGGPLLWVFGPFGSVAEAQEVSDLLAAEAAAAPAGTLLGLSIAPMVEVAQ